MTEESKENIEKKETPFKKFILKGAEEGTTALPLFLGTLKEQHEIIYKISVIYFGYLEAAEDPKREREATALLNQYNELKEEHFKDVDDDEVASMLTSYFSFYFNYFDRTLTRDVLRDLLTKEGISNLILKDSGKTLSQLNPMTTSVQSKLSVRDKMRRSFLKTSGDPDTFSVILLNSLIVMKVKVPTPLDLIRLINDISTKLRLYGERFSISSLNLERAGIGQLIVDFVLDRMTYCSVKDIGESYELKKIIYANDLPVIAQTLLGVSSPKGVAYHLSCLANKCNYNETVVMDPSSMILNVEETMPEKRLELLNRLVNEGHKLSREELSKVPPVYFDKDGNEIDCLVKFNHDSGSGGLYISVPYLHEYFECFTNMAEKINPELQQLAVDFPNPKIYKEKRTEFLSSLRLGEYLHWFSELRVSPPPEEEGEPLIVHREEDPKEFDEGLLDIFNNDSDLYLEAIQKVITCIPRMTYSFIGIMDDVCPKCKKRNEENPTAIKSFTPIDPILNFFDHTRMAISTRAAEASFTEANLS